MCLEKLFQEWLRDCSEIYEMEFAKSQLCQFQVRPKYLGSSEQDMDLSNILLKKIWTIKFISELSLFLSSFGQSFVNALLTALRKSFEYYYYWFECKLDLHEAIANECIL